MWHLTHNLGDDKTLIFSAAASLEPDNPAVQAGQPRTALRIYYIMIAELHSVRVTYSAIRTLGGMKRCRKAEVAGR